MARIEKLLREVCAASDDATRFCSSGDAVTVQWPNSGRGHDVRFQQDSAKDTLTLWALVARAAQIRHITDGDLAKILLAQNRAARVVAFRREGRRGSVEASVVCRASTLSIKELGFYLLILAREADRLEHLLTGEDARLRGAAR